MAQSAVTVTPPSPTPPTNFACTGATPPNVPNFTKNTYANPFNLTAARSGANGSTLAVDERPQSPYGVNPSPGPYFDDAAGGVATTLVFATNTAALASGTAATSGGTENTYPGTGAGFGTINATVNNVGAVTPRLDGFLSVTDDEWIAAFMLNAFGASNCRADEKATETMLRAESLGGLRLGLPEKDVLKLLGPPTKQSALVFQAADGNYVQDWHYPQKGIKLQMSAGGKKSGAKTVANIRASAPCASS
jgi:hypothetical protein